MFIYSEYLQSEHWQKIKNKIYSSHPHCSVCHSKRFLNIHHKTYKNIYHEKDEDLIVLCKTCHMKHHLGLLNDFYKFKHKMKKRRDIYKMKKMSNKKRKQWNSWKYKNSNSKRIADTTAAVSLWYAILCTMKFASNNGLVDAL